jgi:hypothetical protein
MFNITTVTLVMLGLLGALKYLWSVRYAKT